MDEKRYWFKRKLFGWGWQPATWEGWLATGLFVVLVYANWQFRYLLRVFDLTQRDMNWFIGETIILVVLFILLCVQKGEKPKWQWGKRKED